MPPHKDLKFQIRNNRECGYKKILLAVIYAKDRTTEKESMIATSHKQV